MSKFTEFGKRVFQKSSYRLFRMVESYLGHPDVLVAERRGIRFGRFWARLDRKHRERADLNLRLAFPEWDAAKREEVRRQMFDHFGIVAADFMRTPHRTDDELRRTVGEPEGTPFLELREHGKGIIAVPPHMGNWERFGHWVQAKGWRITVVARDADKSSVTERVTELRRMNGMGVISRGDSARDILRLLRKNELVGLLPDQNSREAYIPFFGHLAGTVLGPAVLAIRTGAPIVPAACLRTGPGTYEVICEPTIWAQPGETPEEVTARINLGIENLVRRAPEQYLWVHDRWKAARRRNMSPSDEELLKRP